MKRLTQFLIVLVLSLALIGAPLMARVKADTYNDTFKYQFNTSSSGVVSSISSSINTLLGISWTYTNVASYSIFMPYILYYQSNNTYYYFDSYVLEVGYSNYINGTTYNNNYYYYRLTFGSMNIGGYESYQFVIDLDPSIMVSGSSEILSGYTKNLSSSLEEVSNPTPYFILYALFDNAVGYSTYPTMLYLLWTNGAFSRTTINESFYGLYYQSINVSRTTQETYENGYNTGSNDKESDILLNPQNYNLRTYQDYLDYGSSQYTKGLQDSPEAIGNFSSIMSTTFDGLSNIINTEVFPGITIGLIVGIPILLGLFLIILKIIRG